MNIFEKLTEAKKLIDEALNANVGSLGGQSLPAEALAYKQKLLSGKADNRDVYGIVNAINVLAMANSDVIHIFTHFAGHVNKFSVRVNRADTDYQNNNRSSLMDASVYLDEAIALQELLVVESQLTELIIEAREEAETIAEVEA